MTVNKCLAGSRLLIRYMIVLYASTNLIPKELQLCLIYHRFSLMMRLTK